MTTALQDNAPEGEAVMGDAPVGEGAQGQVSAMEDTAAATTTTTTADAEAENQRQGQQDHQNQEQEQEQEQQQEAAAEEEDEEETPLQPHTATTPGPRAQRLQELYAQRLRLTLGKLGWDNFAECYPTIARGAGGVLRQVQGQMVEKLGEKCEKEFENILVARQVVPKLNNLESLVSDASRRRNDSRGPKPTPPHLLPPRQILTAHLHPSLISHQSLLNARLQNTQAQNALLHDEVRRQRAEVNALLAALDDAVADVRGANEALGPLVEELAAESRAAGVEMPQRL